MTEHGCKRLSANVWQFEKGEQAISESTSVVRSQCSGALFIPNKNIYILVFCKTCSIFIFPPPLRGFILQKAVIKTRLILG